MSYYGYSYTSDDEDDIDPDAPIAGPSRSQDWYVNPTPEVEGRAGQYEHEGYDLIDASGNQFVDPYAIHPGVYTGVEPGELLCFRSQLGPIPTIFLDTNVDGVYIPSQVGCPPEGGLESTHLPCKCSCYPDQRSIAYLYAQISHLLHTAHPNNHSPLPLPLTRGPTLPRRLLHTRARSALRTKSLLETMVSGRPRL